MNKKFYYYGECENQDRLFKLLDKNVNEGLITYKIDEPKDFVIINLIEIDEDDDLFIKLERLDLIEDEYYDGDYDEDYDDFYSDDDYED